MSVSKQKYRKVWEGSFRSGISVSSAATKLLAGADLLREKAVDGLEPVGRLKIDVSVVESDTKLLVKRFEDVDVTSLEAAAVVLTDMAEEFKGLAASDDRDLIVETFHVQLVLGTDDLPTARKHGMGKVTGRWVYGWFPRWSFFTYSIDELVQELRNTADEFEAMAEAGVEISDGCDPGEGQFELVTEDHEVGERLGFEEEVWDDLEYEDEEEDTIAEGLPVPSE